MNGWVAAAIAIGISTLGIALVVTSPDSTIVLGGGTMAVASAGVFAALWAAPRVRRTSRPPHRIVTDPLGGLQDALSAGSFGRERVVFAIQDLEFRSGSRSGATWSPQQVRELLALPPKGFRDWLEAHLDALERET